MHETSDSTSGSGETGTVGATQTGLSEEVAGALCYVLGFVTGAVFYLLEDENEFVRFHAVQSIVVFGGLLVLSVALQLFLVAFGWIPVIGGLFAALAGMASVLLGLAALVLWIVLIVKAYQGKRYRLPRIGAFAERYV